MKQLLKTVLGPVIVLLTVVVFAYYLGHHPQTVERIRQTPPLVLLLLVALYMVWLLALALITRGSLRLYHKYMSRQENLLFNAYSSLINFFGPGQSGPVFRGVYLKKRHQLGIKQYIFATLLYYACYAALSALLLLVGSRPWWQTLGIMLLVGVGSLAVVRRYKRRSHVATSTGTLRTVMLWIFGATVLQIATQAVIYGVELRSVGAHPSLGQILSYTGVANFSLFVAITPGAIGIREAFLRFGEGLHHLDTSTIVAANVVDRAGYLLFLGVLLVLVIGLHATDKLHLRTVRSETPDE